MLRARLESKCLRRHGIDMHAVVLICPDTGRSIVSVLRWSEPMAKRDAAMWASRHGYELVSVK
jgi:hypothetical protein